MAVPRAALLWLLVACLFGVVQSRSIGDGRYHDMLERFFKRQTNNQASSCPSRGPANPAASAVDDFGKPESTDKEILNENLAAYAQFLRGEGQFVSLGESDASAESTDTSTKSIDTSAESVDTSTEGGDASTESTDTLTESTDASTESIDTSTESSDTSIEGADASAGSTDTSAEGTDASAEGVDTSDETADIAARDALNATWAEETGPRLQPRINGRGRLRHQTAEVKVPTNGARVIIYDHNRFINTQVMSTDDLCGCTVFVVNSPLASIMLHVLERRAIPDFQFQGPDSTKPSITQAIMDGEFVAKGRSLLLDILRPFGSGPQGYRQWFPIDQTTVTVVAPAANPDYMDWEFWKRREDAPEVGPATTITEDIWRAMGFDVPADGFTPFTIGANQNPVSTHPIMAGAANPQRLIYPTAAKMLLESINDIMIPGRGAAQSTIATYRRRYSNDPAHRTDDREFISVEPFVTTQGTVASVLHYDDNKAIVLTKHDRQQ